MQSRCAYFLVLSSSACAAAPPSSVAALRQCDRQKVSTHVASHIRYFPCSQGTMVITAEHFPSARCNPEGSSREGIFAAARACWMILFTVLGHDSLPWLNRQLRPCLKNWSTSLPQYEHWCGYPRGAPTLKPTAILMASSLILSPSEETGGAFSHAPDSTEPVASSLALDSTSLHDVRMVLNRMSFWLLVEVGTGVSGGK